MITLKISPKGKKGTITLKQNVGIEEAAQFKKTLSEAFEKTSDLTLDVEKVTDIHISILQLIISAYNYAIINKNNFYIKGNQTKNFIHLIKSTGLAYYAENTGEILECEKTNLWITGGK